MPPSWYLSVLLAVSINAFTRVSIQRRNLRLRMGFWDEIDNFIDDAMGRKLGGGSTFYGERKSNFNGPSKKDYEEVSQTKKLFHGKTQDESSNAIANPCKVFGVLDRARGSTRTGSNETPAEG